MRGALGLDRVAFMPARVLMQDLTGVPAVADERAWYPWLALELKKLYDGYGARGVSPPLLWRTNGYEGTVPLIGLIAKFDLTPKDGLELEDQTASMAVLAPLFDR